MARQSTFLARPAPIRGNSNEYRRNNERGGGRGGRGGYTVGGRRYEGHRPGERRFNNDHSNRARELWRRRQYGGDLSLLGGHNRACRGDADNYQVQDRGLQFHNAAEAVHANHQDAQRNNPATNITNDSGNDTSIPDIQALLNRNRALLSSINTAAANTTATATSIFTPFSPNTLTTAITSITPVGPAFTLLSEHRKAEALAERRRMQLRRDEALAATKVKKPYHYKGNDLIKKMVQNKKLRAIFAGRKVPGQVKRHDAMVLKLGPRDMGIEHVEELDESEADA